MRPLHLLRLLELLLDGHAIRQHLLLDRIELGRVLLERLRQTCGLAKIERAIADARANPLHELVGAAHALKLLQVLVMRLDLRVLNMLRRKRVLLAALGGVQADVRLCLLVVEHRLLQGLSALVVAARLQQLQ